VGLILPAVLVVVLDQLTKQFFWRNGQNYTIIEGFFHITLVRNPGAAFGVLQGGRLFFVIASIVAIVLIVYVGWRLPREHRYRRLLLGLILGGAVGNLIDRLLFGQVIDFVQIGFRGHYWPVFNVADMAVTIGAVLLVLYAVRGTKSTPGEPTPSAPHYAPTVPESNDRPPRA
jgi:signal peptidase II